MTDYIMANAPDVEKHMDSCQVICATHLAPAGTFMCWPNDDFTRAYREPVFLWAVMDFGYLAPMTINGPWGGPDDVTRNKFILHSDGTCSDDTTNWPSLDQALSYIKQYRHKEGAQ